MLFLQISAVVIAVELYALLHFAFGLVNEVDKIRRHIAPTSDEALWALDAQPAVLPDCLREAETG